MSRLHHRSIIAVVNVNYIYMIGWLLTFVKPAAPDLQNYLRNFISGTAGSARDEKSHIGAIVDHRQRNVRSTIANVLRRLPSA